MPRLYRESPVNAIWEGSGNVIALDAVRAMAREPDAVDTFVAEIELGAGGDRRLDAAIDALRDELRDVTDPEAGARRLVERMAVVWAASLAVRYADPAVADAFVATRVAGDHGHLYGTMPTGLPLAAIARRAVPAA